MHHDQSATAVTAPDTHDDTVPAALPGAEADVAAPPAPVFSAHLPALLPAVPAARTVAVKAADRELSAEATTAIGRGVPEATRAAYSGDWGRFERWCADKGRTALPATPETVAEYITHLTWGQGKAIGTADRAMSSIRVMHGVAALPKPELTGARKVLAGYADHLARIGDPKAAPRRAAAADLPALRAMLSVLDRATLVGKRDAALLLLGFKLAARESELVAMDLEHVTPHPQGMEVRLYRGKTRKLQELAVKFGKNDDTCPVRAFRAWARALAEHGRTSGPVFVRIDKHGNLAVAMTRHGRPIGDPAGRLTTRAIDPIIASAARAAGLSPEDVEREFPHWSGHSLRRGFATAAHHEGADMLKIGRAGGWEDGSKTLLGYIDEDGKWDPSPLDDLL